MNLHSLSKSNTYKKSQRIGRGGKRGTTSGRGQKGQKSRAGHRIRPASRDLLLRLPKMRGFRNKPSTKNEVVEVNFSKFVSKVRPLATGAKKESLLLVDAVVLKQLNLIGMRTTGPVKLIGKGSIDFSVELKGIRTSASIAATINKAGGKVSQ